MAEELNSYQRNFPRYDLFTGEIIKFKSKEQYLSSYFNNRTNMAKHLLSLNVEEAECIISEIISSRKESKKLEYALSSAETQTIIYPSPKLVLGIGLDYNELNKKLGLKTKYVYSEIKEKKLPKSNLTIICDTREQTPFKIEGAKVESDCLKFGDYALKGKYDIVIERKSLNDLIGSLSKGYERFCREMIRAEESDSKVLIVVEENINTFLSFNYLPQFKWVKATVEFIGSRLRSLLQNFPNVQIVFANGRTDAANLTKFALAYGVDLFNYDVQYLYQGKKLDKFLS